MAINEACQLWIEQRITEELAERGDTGKSLREIGRELAAEIERVFEAKVNPGTLFQKVRRATDTNVSTAENPATTPVSTGDSGDAYTPEVVVRKIDALVDKRKVSIREAAAIVADEYGKKTDAVRRTYAREKERTNYESTATQAWQFAEIAISQLGRIRKDDPGRPGAFKKVKDWIDAQEDTNGDD